MIAQLEQFPGEAVIAKALAAFPGCDVSWWRDESCATTPYCARITLPAKRPGGKGSWCANRADTPLEALEGVLALALEPAPGFPGWVEDASLTEIIRIPAQPDGDEADNLHHAAPPTSQD